ncbi:MAG TPA: twin-arginine translocase subunit TatC [Bacteroidales bacterium]|nr:twin-arginine translocase subunit TatC [Bacteroidales bacterium]
MAFWNKKGGKNKEGEMSFLQHLEELRWHLIRSFLSICILSIVAFFFKNFIFDTIILAPKNPDFLTNRFLCNLGHKYLHSDVICLNSKPFQLISIQMSGQITTHITVALVTGLILSAPYILYEFWKFFAPALYPNEKKYVQGAVLWSTFLFLVGVVFGYYLIVPLSVHFLGSYEVSSQVINQINIRSYIGTLTSIVLATGLIFELPLITFVLTKIGIITPQFLIRYRRHSIVVIFIIAAVITPPDVFSQTLVAIPLLMLFEIGILVSKIVYREKQKKHERFMTGESQA